MFKTCIFHGFKGRNDHFVVQLPDARDFIRSWGGLMGSVEVLYILVMVQKSGVCQLSLVVDLTSFIQSFIHPGQGVTISESLVKKNTLLKENKSVFLSKLCGEIGLKHL